MARKSVSLHLLLIIVQDNIRSRLKWLYVACQLKLTLHCSSGMCSVDRIEANQTCYADLLLYKFVFTKPLKRQSFFAMIFVLPFSISNHFSVIKLKFIIYYDKFKFKSFTDISTIQMQSQTIVGYIVNNSQGHMHNFLL